jgi:hypothetical protein
MNDDRFTNSPSRPFRACRNEKRTEKARAALATLAASVARQVAKLDFKSVFLEESELRKR